ncbi:hypothetical protein [Romboutsia sp.]|uniref:hypothetical protein n=1 Tax=Romboutsia sp. TaxID=1965302 RepID=UPI003F32206F
MKKSTNVISLRRWRFSKKYGKLFKNQKYLFVIILIPMLLASIFIMDKMIMNFLLTKKGIDSNRYQQTKIETSVDEEFKEKYKNK